MSVILSSIRFECQKVILIEQAMGLWSSIKDNKAIVTGFSLAGLAGLLYWVDGHYRHRKLEELHVEAKSQNLTGVRAKLALLKREINGAEPTFDQLESFTTLVEDYIRSERIRVYTQIKQHRRKRFPKEVRFDRLGEYMQCALEGAMRIKEEYAQIQQQKFMEEVGIDERSLERYLTQIELWVNQEEHEVALDFQSLEKARRVFKLKTSYLGVYGTKIASKLAELNQTLSEEQKDFLPAFINVILCDELFEDEPELDEMETQLSQDFDQPQLADEIGEYEQVFLHIIKYLQKAQVLQYWTKVTKEREADSFANTADSCSFFMTK